MMVIINLAGFLLIGLIIWWFWLYKPEEVLLQDSNIVITVENGIYSPANINLEKNKSAVLTFLRKDASPCAELVIIPELDISETLPLNKPVEINLPRMEKGNYVFHCQMQMYRGELNVV
jgi:plastocyanin domain-containing protein